MKVKTKAKGNDVQLGQGAFVVVSTDGEVERTMVGALEANGYRFLNGCSDGREHSFDFDQAVATADERLKTREAELRATLRALGRRRKYLESAEYKDRVMTTPYKVVDLRQVEKRQRTLQLKVVSIPVMYLYPGCLVYVVITPLTQHRYDVYRPYKHFVLETKVQSVCFTADGEVHHTFSTPFVVDDFFLNKDDAVEYLSNFSEPGTLETIPYVSHEEEKKQLLEDDVPF